MIEIRLVMPGDLDAILSLAELQIAETLPHLDCEVERVRQAVHESLTTGSPVIFVAVLDGEVIGHLWGCIYDYHFTSGVFAAMDVLYVRPDKRGTRAAVKLLREYIGWGRIVGARETLFGVSSGIKIERTARLLEHMGAARIGTLHRIVGDAHVRGR